MVFLDENEWTRPDSEGFQYGQHFKMQGSMGYVNWHLIDQNTADCFRKSRD